MGQCDRDDPSPAGRDLRLDRIEEGLVGIAGVDHDHLASPDEDRVRRSTAGPE